MPAPHHSGLTFDLLRRTGRQGLNFARMTRRLSFAAVLLWVPAALATPRTFVVDERASTATAHVGKTGIASFAGHEHNIVAHKLQGEVVLDEQEPSKSSIDLIVDARSLKVSEKGEPEG